MNWMPDMSDPLFWRNVTMAAGVPGLLSYALNRALGGGLAAAEADRFEKQVRDFVQAENPVMSLDPHLNDEEEEAAVASIGTGPTGGRDSLWRKARRLVTRRSSFEVTGKLEPGLLLAMGWIAAMAGKGLAGRHGAVGRLKAEDERYRKLMNKLEQSEYSRLFFANDPEKFIDTHIRREPPDEVSPGKQLDRDLAGGRLLKQAAAPLVSRRANPEKGGGQEVGINEKGAGEKAGDWFKDMVALGGPSFLLAVALGGYMAGNHIGKRTDPARQRQQALKKILEREMLDNQTPSLLSVGSELPWEKARHLPPVLAADSSVGLPVEAEKARERERREIRI